MKSNEYEIYIVDDEVHISINNAIYEINFIKPNGIGYAFVASHNNERASLDYCYKNHPGAIAKYKRQRFEMTDTEAIDEKRSHYIKILADGEIIANCDNIIMALFIVNHHYWNKSGPFKTKLA
jgi:hypothetical protein